MTFNDNDKLVSFSFIKFYKKTETPKYEKNAKKDYQKILDHVAEQLNDKGESKTYYKTSKFLDMGQEWAGATTLVQIKKAYTANLYTSLEINFNYPGSY